MVRARGACRECVWLWLLSVWLQAERAQVEGHDRPQVARALLVQTWQVEETGGLLTTDGTNRRRTAGGVFFWLVKQRVNAAQRSKIFHRSVA